MRNQEEQDTRHDEGPETEHGREGRTHMKGEYLLGNTREADVDGSSKPSANLANARSWVLVVFILPERMPV